MGPDTLPNIIDDANAIKRIINATKGDTTALAVAYCIQSNGAMNTSSYELYKIAKFIETGMSSHDKPAFNIVDYLDAIIDDDAIGKIADAIDTADADDLFDEIYALTQAYINRYR